MKRVQVPFSEFEGFFFLFSVSGCGISKGLTVEETVESWRLKKVNSVQTEEKEKTRVGKGGCVES